jgi:hypothetical protein
MKHFFNFFLLLSVLISFVPSFVYAQTNTQSLYDACIRNGTNPTTCVNLYPTANSGNQPPTPYTPITGKYILLAPLPGTTAEQNCRPGECTATIDSYLGGFLNLIIGLGAVLSFVYFALWGFQYATSDSATVKSDAKDKLWDTFIGFLLVISSYAIINTINPNLLNLDLNIFTPRNEIPISTSTGGAGTPTTSPVAGRAMTAEEITASNAIKTSLAAQGVTTYQGPCTQGQVRLCVNLNGLPPAAQTSLVTLKNACGCSINLTGATEGGHAAGGPFPHAPGSPVVDMSDNATLRQYVMNNKLGSPTYTAYGYVYEIIVNGKRASFLDEGATAPGSTGSHWHVVFP